MFLPFSNDPIKNNNTAITKAKTAILSLLLSCLPSLLYAQDKPLKPGEKPAWLEGTDDKLKIKITGEVVDENGAAVNDCHLTAEFPTLHEEKSTAVTVDRNRFSFWVDANNQRVIYVRATSQDGKKIAFQRVVAYEFRQKAIDGLILQLVPVDRIVNVAVVENGKPVEGAHVSAEVDGMTLKTKTDKDGIARYSLLKNGKIGQLICWTDTHQFGMIKQIEPIDDKQVSKDYKIELTPCRTQVIRFFDQETKTPVKNLPISFTVSSSEPQRLYFSTSSICNLKTNEQGEAKFDWLPDWKNPKFYISILDPHWFIEGSEPIEAGVANVNVQKSRFDQRKRFIGQLTSLDLNQAGFLVEMQSFQGEAKHFSDYIYAFTNEKGQFTANCLPGATYCIYVSDARHVSNIIDMVPISNDKVKQPELRLSAGQKVEVTFTAGPSKKPVANQSIILSTNHEYQWLENNEPKYGTGRRDWWVRTDQNGKVYTYALEGSELQGSIYNDAWSSSQSLKVSSHELNKLDFHQAFPVARKITGRLILEGAMKADLNEATIDIGSIDNEIKERMTVKTNPKGEFEFQSKSTMLGILAQTKDGKAAVISTIDQSAQNVELNLKPTTECRGQLLEIADKPLAGAPISLYVTIAGKGSIRNYLMTRFTASTFETKTDERGFYTFKGVPTNAEITLTMGANGKHKSTRLENFRIEPNETLPLLVSELETPTRKLTFAERYQSVVRDCDLSHFHTMMILSSPSKQNTDFINANLVNYGVNKANSTYMQILGEIGQEEKNKDVMELARSKNWPIPKDGKIVALAIDGKGKLLGHIEIDPNDAASVKLTFDFVEKYAPKQDDAKKKWDEAFAEAKASGKKVWVRISQRYCGPCFKLTRWLDDQKELLSKDYIMLKIDNVSDLNGNEVSRRIPKGLEMGIPFHAIFDADEKVLITSEGPLGNIGHPSGIEGKKHLRKMLLKSCKKLTDKEIENLLASIRD